MPRERAAEKGPERPPAAGPPDSRSLRLSPGARAPPGPSWQTRNELPGIVLDGRLGPELLAGDERLKPLIGD